LAHARYLCKRLRGQFANVKILVGRWGQSEGVERVTERLKNAGADFVATSVEDTQKQMAPLLQVARAVEAAAH
ncbi:MAG TPA: hypothetical protein VGG61_08090, partial [Gemmataceae bacterium]